MYMRRTTTLPPSSCEETGAWRAQHHGLDWQPQDGTLPVPCRHAWDPQRSAGSGRPLLSFFAGSLDSCPRRLLFERYGIDKQLTSLELLAAIEAGLGGRIWVFNGSVAPAAPARDDTMHFFDVSTPGELLYRDFMFKSEFCLLANGTAGANSARLTEVIMHGCIPVVVSDDFQAPFHRNLNWSDFAIFVRTREIPMLQDMLEAITLVERAQKRMALEAVAPFLDMKNSSFWFLLLDAMYEGVSLSLSASSQPACRSALAL